MAETKITEYLGTGRRKTAVARVRLASGTGKITVNGRPFENYFPLETLRVTATQPLTSPARRKNSTRASTSAAAGPTARPARCGTASPGRCCNSTRPCGAR